MYPIFDALLILKKKKRKEGSRIKGVHGKYIESKKSWGQKGPLSPSGPNSVQVGTTRAASQGHVQPASEDLQRGKLHSFAGHEWKLFVDWSSKLLCVFLVGTDDSTPVTSWGTQLFPERTAELAVCVSRVTWAGVETSLVFAI